VLKFAVSECYNDRELLAIRVKCVKFYSFAVAVLLTGCGVFSVPDMPATLQAENIGYVVEATALADSAARTEQQIQVTAEAAGTRVAESQMVNRVLLATVRAGDAAVVRNIVANTIATPVDLEPGQRWFVKTGTSSRVRSMDGCVEDARLRFPANTERIYATVRAFNIGAGVVMSAQWEYEGTTVWQDSWVLNQGSSDICMWFDIDRYTVDFLPGSWSVRLFADGFQLEEAMSFSIAPPDEM
jgi:hypothetical protein